MKLNKLVAFVFPLVAALVCVGARSENVLVEAESFKEKGGWSLDTQFIHIMGSPYLLAHGLGEPVKDAETDVEFPAPGKYHVYVRTKDWVAHWKAPGAPGKFQVLVDGKALGETFGTKSAEWFWHDGGSVDIAGKSAKVALHDLTGFDGRCDAILFSTDATPPTNDAAALSAFRKKCLGLPEKPVDGGSYDLVVVGGGYGGMGAALAAARAGCKVALIQDRPVLGGNGSSEIRVWAMGGTRRGLYPMLGEIIDEFADKAKQSPGTFEEFGDAKKEALVRAEKNISLFLNNYMLAVEMDGKKIVSVTSLDTRTSVLTRFTSKYFCDSTGHGTVGALAGADLTIKETGHMGMSNMWRWKDTGAPQAFPDVTEWCLPLAMIDFPYPQRGHAPWFWEGGFGLHPINDLEYIRDWNLRASFGAFNAMKNKDGKDKHVNAKMEWLAYVGGNRESRQLLGDVILTREDIVGKKAFEDGCVPTTWDIDLHYPKEQYAKKFPEAPFISKAEFGSGVDRKEGYPVPYRCMYSRNIENLFVASRCLSVTHEALGTVRVMKTLGMCGEVVGKAASVAVKYSCKPRDVYSNYFIELKELMQVAGKARREKVTDKMAVPEGETPLPPVAKGAHEEGPMGIDPKTLPGIVIDNTAAKLTGTWAAGHGLEGYVGTNYFYHAPKKDGAARFEFTVTKTGKYDVKVNNCPHENRASNAAVTIESADGKKTVKVNQKEVKGFGSVGVFKFEAGKPGAVVISTDGANGNVQADAVQVVPAE